MPYSFEESEFAEKVRHELEAARAKHGKPINSPLEAYGVIMEEVCEFFDECLGRGKGTRINMVHELVQIAAMCQRAAEDLKMPVSSIVHRHRYADDAEGEHAYARDLLKAMSQA